MRRSALPLLFLCLCVARANAQVPEMPVVKPTPPAMPVVTPPAAAPAPVAAPPAVPAQAAPAPAAKQAMGTLLIDAPAGQPVTVDGQTLGTTPLPGPWTVAAGAHQVTVGSEKRGVEVPAGEQTTARFRRATAPVAKSVVEREVKVVNTGPGFSLSTAGYVVGGIGLAAVGAGVFLGLQAQDKADEVDALDRADARASRARMQEVVDESDALAFYANTAYGVGGVALASGIAMILLASDGPLGVSVAPTPGGAIVGGRF